MEIVLQRAFQVIYKDIGSIGVLGIKITKSDGSERAGELNLLADKGSQKI